MSYAENMGYGDDVFLDIETKVECHSPNTAWFFANHRINGPIRDDESNLYSIVPYDTMGTETCLSNEARVSSASPSELTCSDSMNMSPLETVPLMPTYNGQGLISPLDSNILKGCMIYNNNSKYNGMLAPENEMDETTSLASKIGNGSENSNSSNYSILDNNSYVIVDKTIFENLIQRSQLLDVEHQCNQNINVNRISSSNQYILSNNQNNIQGSGQNPTFSSIELGSLEDMIYVGNTKSHYIKQNMERNEFNCCQPFYVAVIENGSECIPTAISDVINLPVIDESPSSMLLNRYPTTIKYQTSNGDSFIADSDRRESIVDISDSDAEETKDLCFVCGDVASCQHYGVKSCEGCKGFFKRTIQKNVSHTYTCLQNGDCIIDKQNRNRCQSCRFEKCVKVGMVKEIVRKESLKGRRGRLSSKVKMKSNGSQSLYTVVNLLSTVSTAISFTEPRCVDKLAYKDFLAVDKLQRKMKPDGIISYVINEFHESMKMVKQFSDKLIGFSTLSKRDQNLIILLNGLEFLTLRSALRHLNVARDKWKSLKGSIDDCVILDNSSILTKNLLSKSIFNEWSKNIIQLSSELIELQKCDQEIINGLLVVTLLRIEIDSDESKLLEDSSLVYSLRHRYVEVLKTYCGSKSNPETSSSSNQKATANPIICLKPSESIKSTSPLPDSKLLSKLLDKQTMVQSIVKDSLLKPIIRHYFGTDDIRDCDKVITNLMLGQEIVSFCPKWLFKLVMYKTLPHLCKHQFA